MSRSIKACCAGGNVKRSRSSERKDKKLWHRTFRTKTKQAVHLVLKNGWDDESLDWDVPFFHRLQAGGVCNFQKDGKRWYFPRNFRKGEAFLRKDVRCVFLVNPERIWFLDIKFKHRMVAK